jgi:hypothetical protein
MIASLLLLLLADPPWAERSRSDARALEAVKASEIVEPLAECLRQRIAAHSLTPGQAGSETAAQTFAVWLMNPCGAADARVRLIEAMRAADPKVTRDDAERRVGTLMGSVLSAAAIQAYKHFRVAPRAPGRTFDCARPLAPRPEDCTHPPAPVAASIIELPHQAEEAFNTYRRCVLGRFDVAIRSVRNPQDLRRAQIDSLAACRDVRAVQLERGSEKGSDSKIHGSRDQLVEAFDRFDRKFETDSDAPPASPETSNREPGN